MKINIDEVVIDDCCVYNRREYYISEVVVDTNTLERVISFCDLEGNIKMNTIYSVQVNNETVGYLKVDITSIKFFPTYDWRYRLTCNNQGINPYHEICLI